MGYTGYKTETVKEVIANLNASRNVIKHHRKGNEFWQLIKKADDTHVIVVNIIEKDRSSGEVYVKSLTEDCGPYYYNCPLAWLDIAEEACSSWRERVRTFHARTLAVKNIKAGTRVKLEEWLSLNGVSIGYEVVTVTDILKNKKDKYVVRTSQGMVRIGLSHIKEVLES